MSKTESKTTVICTWQKNNLQQIICMTATDSHFSQFHECLALYSSQCIEIPFMNVPLVKNKYGTKRQHHLLERCHKVVRVIAASWTQWYTDLIFLPLSFSTLAHWINLPVVHFFYWIGHCFLEEQPQSWSNWEDGWCMISLDKCMRFKNEQLWPGLFPESSSAGQWEEWEMILENGGA